MQLSCCYVEEKETKATVVFVEDKKLAMDVTEMTPSEMMGLIILF